MGVSWRGFAGHTHESSDGCATTCARSGFIIHRFVWRKAKGSSIGHVAKQIQFPYLLFSSFELNFIVYSMLTLWLGNRI